MGRISGSRADSSPGGPAIQIARSKPAPKLPTEHRELKFALLHTVCSTARGSASFNSRREPDKPSLRKSSLGKTWSANLTDSDGSVPRKRHGRLLIPNISNHPPISSTNSSEPASGNHPLPVPSAGHIATSRTRVRATFPQPPGQPVSSPTSPSCRFRGTGKAPICFCPSS